MSSFEFLKELPQERPEIEEFLEIFQPSSVAEQNIISAINIHYDIIKLINEELTSINVSGMMSSEAYNIIKKFGKEVEEKSLREIRRELLDDVSRLRQKL